MKDDRVRSSALPGNSSGDDRGKLAENQATQPSAGISPAVFSCVSDLYSIRLILVNISSTFPLYEVTLLCSGTEE
jgi:hypothetical protein